MSGGSFYATRVLSDDPRFYLRLGEASGFTAYDETANGLDGTIHYSTYGPTLGQPSLINDSDPSMHFHGGYVRIYDDTVDSSEYSVEAWISKDDSGTARGFMGRAAPDSDLIMALRFWVDANDKVNVGITHWCCTDPIGQASFLQAVGSTTIVPGVAYHVAATVRQGELLRLYVNGVEEASAGPVRIPYFVGSQWAGSGHWRIGNSGNNASPWLGEIDEWAGYDYALTPDRIAANYIVGLTGSEFNPFETLGSRNPSELHRCQGCLGDPVNTATGNFFEDFTDLAIPGRGVPLDFSRTYNSLAASIDGPLGRGWSHSYMTSLQFVGDTVTVNQENGSQVAFTLENGVYTAPPRVTATLVENPDGTFTLTRMRRTFLTFNASGKLIKQQDLNGKGASPQYSTTLAYNGAGRLATVTDPANRTLTFDYWPSGLLKSVMDSASPARTVSFAYDGDGNLSDVTDVGGGVTHMTYDAAHRLVTLLDPNQEDASSAEPLTIGYDASGRVGWQTDTLGLLTEFDYATVPGSTLYTDPKGNKILHLYEAGQLVSETRGYGTSKAATWEYEFDETLGVTSVTDPNNHVTTSSYDGRGNLVSRIVDPGGLNRETIYEYDSLNDLTLIEDPSGVATTMTYDANGNLETTETPLYAADGVTVLATRTTELDYPSAAHPGDVGSMIDANNKTWTYS